MVDPVLLTYRAEAVARLSLTWRNDPLLMSRKEVEDRVSDITASSWWEWNFTRFGWVKWIRVESPKREAGVARAEAQYPTLRVMTFDGIRLSMLVHELSHVVAVRSWSDPGHGAGFRSVYLALLDKIMGRHNAELMFTSFVMHGLSVHTHASRKGAEACLASPPS